jgi:hypothetical protein
LNVIDQEITERYALYNGDACEVLRGLPGESVHFSVYSPPFPELYAYSNDPRDISNCVEYSEGLEHYRYVVNEVYRLTMPGRLSAVHCMDLKKGTWFQRDFPGDIVRLHQDAGWHFFCRITIWKDPWLIARRTKMKTLMHMTVVKDSARSRVAGPDYVLVFAKGGVNPEPIRHPEGLKRYAGEKPVPLDLLERFRNYKGDQRKNLLSHWIWRRYASPVWDDIRGGRLLPYEDSRENEEEKHVCRLQLDVIDRCLTLWSNPGDIVCSPFAGVGSELCGAVMHGRKAVGVELKKTYYNQALKNLRTAIERAGGDTEEADLFAGVPPRDEVNEGD